jgi:hypothetical protein
MKTDYEINIALKLEGLGLVEEAIAEHLKNNFDTICDMKCREEWADGRYRKCCNKNTCDILAREEEFSNKIKLCKLKYFINAYHGLFHSDMTLNKYRLINQKITLEDKVFNLLSKISQAKKFLSELTESEFNSFEGRFDDLWSCSFEACFEKNKRYLTDVKCFPIKCTDENLLLNMETGELYSSERIFNSKRFFYIMNFPKLNLYDNQDGSTFCEVNRDSVYESEPITPEHIKKIKHFGEDDYKMILDKAKTRLTDYRYRHTGVFLINIEKISYGSIKIQYDCGFDKDYTIAVITDKNGNNITIAHEKEIASTDNTRCPDDANYYNNDDRHHNIFFSIKPSDLVGSTLIAEFYVCKDKIYAEPISVLTDENLIHLKP